MRISKVSLFPRGLARPTRFVEVRERAGLAVEVEFSRPLAERIVTGITIRRDDGGPLTARFVKRSALDKHLRAAIAAISTKPNSTPDEKERDLERRRIAIKRALSRDTRGRGKGTAFYRHIAELRDVLDSEGKKASRVIADEFGVDVNTVYQWFHRARSIQRESESGTTRSNE